jgi:hypothetical protein
MNCAISPTILAASACSGDYNTGYGDAMLHFRIEVNAAKMPESKAAGR